MSIFHRLEDYGFGIPRGNYVTVSFKTTNAGLWQCQWDETGINEIDQEPPLKVLRKSEQDEITEVGPYIFYMTHGELPNI